MGTKLPFLISISLAISFLLEGQVISPYAYWTFDNGKTTLDISGKHKYDNTAGACHIDLNEDGIGGSICFGEKNCPVSFYSLENNISTSLTIEFLFRGERFIYLSYPEQLFSIQLEYPEIRFVTSAVKDGKVVQDNLSIAMNRTGVGAFSYVTDNNWHHFVFTADAIKGTKEIWIDGELRDGFSKKMPSGSKFIFGANDGFTFTNCIDELAFYNVVLPGNHIRQHYSDFKQKVKYKFSVSEDNLNTSKEPAKQIVETVDTLEFAPGYPLYTIQAKDQLTQYPLPRWKRNVSMNRNFPWTAIDYLHRELPGNGGKGFGKTDPKAAVVLTDEMARNWNYYIELQTLRYDSTAAIQEYSNPASLYGALLKFANDHPEFPTATVTLQMQNHPSQAGYGSGQPFVTSQELERKYYMQDKTGSPVIYKGQKWLSPLMPTDIIQKDGWTSRFYLEQLLKFLKRPLDIISENAEYFGHIRDAELIRMDPRVFKKMQDMGMNESRFSGWFQNILDSVYKSSMLSLPALQNTKYTYYNLSAVHSQYWPDYQERRNINSKFNGYFYSTPDFYPGTPSNWSLGKGSMNGYGVIAEGRKVEMDMGTPLFSPFVNAGFGFEEDNIRPAQWLALLKAMSMLGAEFFHVAYFNVTGEKGWLNGAGPNDPRGYIYQVAMPVYAQAVSSYYLNFLTEGKLLNPDPMASPEYQFRQKGKNPGELIMVRKLGRRFLIFGCIQPQSNIKGNVPMSTTTEIKLDSQRIKLNIRRQGSIYIYDLSDPGKPILIQLDGWHEYKHPYYWSKDIAREAEIPDNDLPSSVFYTMASSADKSDFTNSVTWCRLEEGGAKPEYDIFLREKQRLNLFVKVKTNNSNAILMIRCNGHQYTVSVIRHDGNWNWYKIDSPISIDQGKNTIELQSKAGKLDIDHFILSSKESIGGE